MRRRPRGVRCCGGEPVTTEQSLLNEVAHLIEEYREASLPSVSRGPRHVERWVSQFPPDSRGSILRDMSAQFGHYFVTRSQAILQIEQMLDAVASHYDGGIRATGVIPGYGSRSQQYWTSVAERTATSKYGNELCRELARARHFLIIDDCTYTHTSLTGQLRKLIDAPFLRPGCTLHLCFFATHTREPTAPPERKARFDLAHQVAQIESRGVSVTLSFTFRFKNWRTDPKRFDLYWPRQLGEDALLAKYVSTLMSRPGIPLFRPATAVGDGFAFDDESSRTLTEWEFVRAGLKILDGTKHWGTIIRPMGWDPLPTLGFGAVFSTFRNIPNTAPLALWATYGGWYPLLPRLTRPSELL